MKTQDRLVDEFAQTMKDELANNQHKGDWREWKDIEKMHQELQYHLEKLKISEDWTKYNFSEDVAKEKIKEHLADCGNFLLMIGNAYGIYNDPVALVHGCEEGDICNRDGCKGIIKERDGDRHCSCHISPPCPDCCRNYNYCPECEWEPEQP